MSIPKYRFGFNYPLYASCALTERRSSTRGLLCSVLCYCRARVFPGLCCFIDGLNIQTRKFYWLVYCKTQVKVMQENRKREFLKVLSSKQYSREYNKLLQSLFKAFRKMKPLQMVELKPFGFLYSKYIALRLNGRGLLFVCIVKSQNSLLIDDEGVFWMEQCIG